MTDQAAGWRTSGHPAPGWYPDPWVGGQHRYWTGEAWTADVFPDGPTFRDREPATDWGLTYPPQGEPPAEVVAPTPPPARRPRSGRALAVVALVVGLIVGFTAVVAAVNAIAGKSGSSAGLNTSPTPPATAPPQGSSPAVPADPDTSALPGLMVSQSDVASTASVQPIPGGDTTADPTLDLCNGTFPSEVLRTARLQVSASDAQGNAFLSTEAVLYPTAAGPAQAFGELRNTAANCPATPVPSPVGEPTATTHFNAAPDATWSQTPSVERLAFDFTSTDSAGQTRHSAGVYLRRGRVLMGVYFPQPDRTQQPVGGQTTIGGIVNLFAARMARLPASVVNGG